MNNQPPTPRERLSSPSSRDWRALAERRWPLIALTLVGLAIIAWAASRRGTKTPNDGSTDTPAARQSNDSLLTLDSIAQRLAGVELLTVTTNVGGALTTNGTITYDADLVAVISSRVEGRAVKVQADLGQQVRAGSMLAIVESQEVGQIRGDLERARANVDVARRNYEREKRLFEESITPQKELLDAEGTFRTAEADYNSALSKLRAIGAARGSGATFGLVTPVSGTVVERSVSPGQLVGPSTNLFTVADLSRVWITVDVYEGDLARVRSGAGATVIPTALPGESFTGRVTYAGGVVDTASRTFKVRVELSNSTLRLRPGMFAQVRIETPAQRSTNVGATADSTTGALTVPELAVQELRGHPVVFVATDVPGRFIVRTVSLGPRAGNGAIVVTAGLKAGERVVTRGAFQLKAELTKASFGEEG